MTSLKRRQYKQAHPRHEKTIRRPPSVYLLPTFGTIAKLGRASMVGGTESAQPPSQVQETDANTNAITEPVQPQVQGTDANTNAITEPAQPEPQPPSQVQGTDANTNAITEPAQPDPQPPSQVQGTDANTNAITEPAQPEPQPPSQVQGTDANTNAITEPLQPIDAGASPKPSVTIHESSNVVHTTEMPVKTPLQIAERNPTPMVIHSATDVRIQITIQKIKQLLEHLKNMAGQYGHAYLLFLEKTKVARGIDRDKAECPQFQSALTTELGISSISMDNGNTLAEMTLLMAALGCVDEVRTMN